jgi:hypothetical protein
MQTRTILTAVPVLAFAISPVPVGSGTAGALNGL